MAAWAEFCASSTSKLCLRDLHVGEAEVERRAELLVGERADLLASGLACRNGLLRDLEHLLRGERLVEGLIDGERNVVDGGALGFELRLWRWIAH